MNPELERALVAYQARHRSRDLLLIALSLGFVVIDVLDIVITHHVRTRPLVSFGVIGVLGLLLANYMRSLHRPMLLERLRTGIAIRDVRRGAADRTRRRRRSSMPRSCLPRWALSCPRR